MLRFCRGYGRFSSFRVQLLDDLMQNFARIDSISYRGDNNGVTRLV